MKYIIMITIVLGLACADFLTGIIKGYINNTLNSAKMRKGGVNKLGELIIMSTACGLEIGIKALGHYYDSGAFASVTGAVTAAAVFVYIVLMELISIFENYIEINPDASGWVKSFVKRLKNVNIDKEDKS